MIAKRLLVGLVALGFGAAVVVAFDGIQQVRAQQQPPFTVPHGRSISASQLCAICHDWHPTPDPASSAQGELPPDTPITFPWEGLLVAQFQSELCFQCHDGSASSTNVENDFAAQTRVSAHPVLQSKDGSLLVCSDCHAEHQDPAQDVKLLYRETTPGTYVYSPPGSPIGDTFCYGCHGSDSTLPAPFGDKGLFETSIHATSGQVLPDDPLTDITCSACHESHASDFPYLTKANQEDLCFACHSLATPNTANGSSPKRAFSVTANDNATNDGNGVRIYHHPISDTDQEGGTRTVECASCHNSHLVDRTYTASDPASARAMDAGWRFDWGVTSGLYNRSANAASFCGTCHVDPTTTSPLSASADVPYDVNLVNDDGIDADGQTHDKFTATWFATGAGSAHGNPSYTSNTYLGCPPGGPCTLACTACHDFHGSSNASMLREDIVSPDYRPLAITAATWDGTGGGTATLTVGPHGMAKDWYVTVAGTNPVGFDGTWVLTSVTATTVSFALPTDPGAFVSGGTLTTGGPENRSPTATITGFGALNDATDQAKLQTFCLTCHLEQSSTHESGTLCTECHNHGTGTQQPF